MLGREITKLRDELGWSMSRLAQELKISADLIVDWESETRFPTKKHTEALLGLKAKLTDSEQGAT